MPISLVSCGRLAARPVLQVSERAASSAYILDAARTPIGSFRSKLASLSAPQLGSAAIANVLQRCNVKPSAVQEVFMGQVVQSMAGQAPGRQAALLAGLDVSVAVTTINKACASGLKSIALGASLIELGHQKVCIGGGMESMSQIPFYIPRGEPPYGGFTVFDGVLKDGLTDAFEKIHMGMCAEKTAKDLSISREEQDEYAAQSYRKSAAAWKSGAIGPEVFPVNVKLRKGVEVVDRDEEFAKVNFEKLPSLKPAFKKDGGTVTAGNASTLNDGAAAVLLSSLDAAKELGVAPKARIVCYADAATQPIDFPIAPTLVIPKLLKLSGLKKEDIDQFEINEAFAAVVLAAIKKCGLDPAKVNPDGGAVSLGHPIGMSGARLIAHLVYKLKPGQKGLVAICNAGGGAGGMIIEKL